MSDTETDQFNHTPTTPHKVIRGELYIQATPAVQTAAGVIPNTRIETHSGHTFAVMPFTASAVGHLNRLAHTGLRGPAYTWGRYSGPFTPREEQLRTVDFFTQNPRAFCFNGLGTGKTAASIWAAEYLRATEGLQRVLVLCTVSCVDTVWAREIKNLYPNRSVVIATGTKARRAKMINAQADYTIINHHGVTSSVDLLCEQEYDLIIDDEGSVHRNSTSALSKNTLKVSREAATLQLKASISGTRFWLMTATPTPRTPLDAYGLAALVTPERITMTRSAFKQSVEMQVSTHKWVPRLGSEDAAFSLLQPAIRIRTEDCLTLPPITVMTRYIELTAEQKQLRKSIIRDYVMRFAEDNSILSITSASDVVNKILQVAQGVVKDPDHVDGYRQLKATPRVNDLKAIIDEADGQVIVFASYRASCTMLADVLRSTYGDDTVGLMMGGVSANARTTIINNYKNPTHPCRILVAHPKTAAHGLNLTEANTTCWYGALSDAELYEQANARMARPGQTRHMNIIHLVGCPEETRLLDVLSKRMNTQNTIMDMVSEYLNI